MTAKDERWAKQFGDFAEGLVMYVTGMLKNSTVALIDHVGADIIAIDRNDTKNRYAISVKGRNFPDSESKSFNFSQGDINKLRETASNLDMIPAVAFVFVDEQEGVKKIRIFLVTLKNLFELCEDISIEFAQYAMDGITFKYTESQRKHHLSDIKKCSCIDYTELSFSYLTNNLSFYESLENNI